MIEILGRRFPRRPENRVDMRILPPLLRQGQSRAGELGTIFADYDPALARLNTDPDYLRASSRAACAGRLLERNVKCMLRRYASSPIEKLGGALCLRGSHARRDGTPTSDIDLVFVADEVCYEKCQELLSSLQPAFAQRISIQSYHTRLTSYEQESLAVWLSLLHVRYVIGDPLFLQRLAAGARTLLRGRSLRDLLRLYSLDPLRRQLSPEHLDSPIRGYGGIVDYEFARLISQWQKLGRCEPSYEQEWLLTQMELLYRYIWVYRYLTVESTRRDCWFMSDQACAGFRRSLHNRLGVYVSLAMALGDDEAHS